MPGPGTAHLSTLPRTFPSYCTTVPATARLCPPVPAAGSGGSVEAVRKGVAPCVAALVRPWRRYSTYNLTNPLKTSLHFEITRSGLVGVEKAEVVVEFSEWTEVRVPIISNQTVGGNATGNGTQPGAEGGGGEGNATEAASGAPGNATEVAAEEPQYEIKQKLRKRTIRVPLEVPNPTPWLCSRAVLFLAGALFCPCLPLGARSLPHA